jgi:hypothetical protein
MTAQINDTCFHRKIDFAIARISGSHLFDPHSLGFQPVAISTACWRGYVAHYSILGGELFLTSLQIGLPQDAAVRAEAGGGPEFFGVSPTSNGFPGFLYEGFQSPIAFTGSLLLAARFIRELYVHIGFHPAWKYECVREIIFEAGRVTEDHDRSTEMANLRSKAIADFKRSEDRSGKASPFDI